MKRFFLTLMVFLSLFLSVSAGINDFERFYYLNIPETVKQPGILASENVVGSDRTRIFFHYVNGTSKPQDFIIKGDAVWHDLRIGLGVHDDPGCAGTIAVQKFLTSPVQKQPINILYRLMPGKVISGLIDGWPTATDHFVCQLGTDQKIDQLVLKQFGFSDQHNVTIYNGKTIVKIGTDQQKRIPGNYGITENINCVSVSKVSLKVSVSISPRGGDAKFVYVHNGQIHTTPLIPAFQHYELWSQICKPGEIINLSTVPIGGYAYPINVEFKAKQ